MRKIFSHYDKSAINALPRAVFPGRIIVVQGEAEARRAVRFLLAQPLVGIDTETRPNFRPGGMHPVSLLQVSTPDTCFLFRLNMMGLPPCLTDLLTASGTQKIGLSLNDDRNQLARRADFEPGNWLDLQDYVKQLGIVDMSLQKLYANLFGEKISKGQRLTNWDADVLTDAQKLYAATDAWACLRIYDEVSLLLATHDYELVESTQNLSK